MGFLLMAVGVVLDFIALGCAIMFLIHAFQNAVWKGFACLICFIYGLYYLIVEVEHEHKGLIMLGFLVRLLVARFCPLLVLGWLRLHSFHSLDQGVMFSGSGGLNLSLSVVDGFEQYDYPGAIRLCDIRRVEG